MGVAGYVCLSAHFNLAIARHVWGSAQFMGCTGGMFRVLHSSSGATPVTSVSRFAWVGRNGRCAVKQIRKIAIVVLLDS